MNCNSILGRGKEYFFSSPQPDRFWVRSILPADWYRAEMWEWTPTPSTTEVKNTCRYISVFSHIFMTWCLITYRTTLHFFLSSRCSHLTSVPTLPLKTTLCDTQQADCVSYRSQLQNVESLYNLQSILPSILFTLQWCDPVCGADPLNGSGRNRNREYNFIFFSLCIHFAGT